MKYWLNTKSRTVKSKYNNIQVHDKSAVAGTYWKTVGYSPLKQADENTRNLAFYSESSSEDETKFRINNNNTKQMVTKGNYNMRQEFEKSYEELVGSNSKVRKIRIALIFGASIIVVALVVVAVVLLMKSREEYERDHAEKNRLVIDDFITGIVTPRRFNGTWISGNEILYKDENGEIFSFDADTRSSKRLTRNQIPETYESFLYEKSADNKYLLIGKDHLKIFRYSFLAHYDIIDLETGEVHPLEINGEKEPIFLVKWSPVGHGLIINYDRNLYYKKSPSDPEIRLTNDDSKKVWNGHPDWVYEEEVFGSNVAVWFNPSGTKITFIKFNDDSTKVLNLPYYGIPGNLQYQYPLIRPVTYPKAGSANPFVKLYQLNLKDALEEGIPSLREILVPSELNTKEHIITAVTWLDDNSILSVWMNRIQNEAYLQVSDVTKRKNIYQMQPKNGWVDLFTPPIKNKDGSLIAFLSPQTIEKNDDYHHLTIISTNKPANLQNNPTFLTNGKYVVQQILHWDYDTNLIFYTANAPNQSHVLHLYAIKASRSEKPHCLTCGIKSADGEQTYFAAEFSTNGKYIILSTLGPSIPRIDVYEWSFENNIVNFKQIFEWETNNDLRHSLSGKKLPTTEYHTIDIDDGFTANVIMYLPPDMDRSGSTKYPLLVDVYGGPDTYSAVDKFNLDWGSYLASNRSVIGVKIDGRGSGLRGDKLLHSIYLKLGTYEVYDQINVTRKLQEKFEFIDEKHTGIWGWSYGGYASAMALGLDKTGVFKCAASIAPVTDWAYYDSIYTERYMGLPQDNLDGYEKARLTTLAPNFKGKNYLLVHGTLDDNVHYQQAMVFAKALEHNDVMFKQISYPDEDHGLISVRPHLFHSLDKFFGDCFNLNKDKDLNF